VKPKKNHKPGPLDNCQTPAYALDPLIPHLKAAKFRTIWECARGEMYLANALGEAEFNVTATDINDGEYYDFFTYDLRRDNKWFDAIVTNPPYSRKYEWLQRCYDLNMPFALLMPVEMLGSVNGGAMFDIYGIQVIFIRPRVNFKMPEKGWDSSAQFPVAWYTWRMNLPKDMLFSRVIRR
jgi:hypothetical protein